MSFRILISFFGLLTILVGCQPSTSSALLQTDTISFASVQEEVVQAESTVQKPPGDYDNIEFEKVELLSAAPGTKSVLFNSTGSRLIGVAFNFGDSIKDMLRDRFIFVLVEIKFEA